MDVPFSDMITLVYPLVVPFGLVLVRVMGLFSFVPVFSNAAIPGNVKVLLALAITVCIWNTIPVVVPPLSLISLATAIIGEFAVGLLIGLLTALIFMGIQLGGHMLSQQMGLSLAAAYDPMFDQQSTVVEQLAFWLSLMVFFVMGGHRELINALVRSYDTVPMGRGIAPAYLLDVVLGALGAAFAIAAKVAAPGLVVFFLSTVAMGFIGKSMPQINIMSLGLGLNLIIGMAMIMVSLVGWALISEQAWHGFFIELDRIFGRL